MFEPDPPFPEAEAGADLNLHTDMLLQTLTALTLKPFLFPDPECTIQSKFISPLHFAMLL